MNNFIVCVSAYECLKYIVDNFKVFSSSSQEQEEGLLLLFSNGGKPVEEIKKPFGVVKKGPYISEQFRILKYRGKELAPNPDNLPFGEWFKKYILTEESGDIKNLEISEEFLPLEQIFESRFKIKWGNCFCVEQSQILSRSLEYYENILALFTNLLPQESEVEHFLERSWYYIFKLYEGGVNGNINSDASLSRNVLYEDYIRPLSSIPHGECFSLVSENIVKDFKGVLLNLSRPLVLSFENKPEESDGAKRFVDTLNLEEWDYVVVGKGVKWEGFVKTRAAEYLKFLRLLPEDKIVIVSDARDVLCNRNSRDFINKFKAFNRELVVSMEIYCEGRPLIEKNVENEFERYQCVPIHDYWKHSNLSEKVKRHEIFRKFVNAGLICGTAKGLASYYEFCVEGDKFVDDQLALGYYVNTFPERVFCDYEASLLHTSTFGVLAGYSAPEYQNKDAPTFADIFGRGPFFVHIPGIVNIFGQKVLYLSVANLKENLINDKTITIGYKGKL